MEVYDGQGKPGPWLVLALVDFYVGRTMKEELSSHLSEDRRVDRWAEKLLWMRIPCTRNFHVQWRRISCNFPALSNFPQFLMLGILYFIVINELPILVEWSLLLSAGDLLQQVICLDIWALGQILLVCLGTSTMGAAVGADCSDQFHLVYSQ